MVDQNYQKYLELDRIVHIQVFEATKLNFNKYIQYSIKNLKWKNYKKY